MEPRDKNIPPMTTLAVFMLIALAVAASTHAATVVRDSSINSSQFYFGNASGLSNDAPNRPLVSTQARSISVCASGCDYATIQAAVNTLPLILRHQYNITITDARDYAEDLWVPPVSVGDIITASEGSVLALRIQGNCSAPNAAGVQSIHVTNNFGAAVTTIQCMRVTDREPTSDENVSVAIYGSKQVQLSQLNFTASNIDHAILLYSSSAYGNRLRLNNQNYGVLLKRDAQFATGEIGSGAVVGFTGTAATAVYRVHSGYADADNDTATAPAYVLCDNFGGILKSRKSLYCVNALNESSLTLNGASSGVGTFTIKQNSNTSTGGLTLFNTAESASLRLYMSGSTPVIAGNTLGDLDMILNHGGGSVGIGSNLAPTQKLSVNGSGNFSGVGSKLYVGNLSAAIGGVALRQESDASSQGLSVENAAGTASLRMWMSGTAGVINANSGGTLNLVLNQGVGNIGLGTGTSPARKLHVNDSVRIQPRSAAPTSAALGDIYVDSDTNEYCFYNSTSWVGMQGRTCA